MLNHVLGKKLAGVSEVLTVSIITVVNAGSKYL